MIDTPRDAALRFASSPLREGFKLEAIHAYTGTDGAILYWRIRLKHPSSGRKWIRPMHLNGAGYELKELEFPGGKPLYRLHDLATRPGERVVLAEGEWTVDRLAEIGVLATTSGASDSAYKADWVPMAEREVLIWPDNDEPGRRYADEVGKILSGIGCKISVVDLSALGLLPKADAVDWLSLHPGAKAEDVLRLPTVPFRTESEMEKPVASPSDTGDPPPADQLRFSQEYLAAAKLCPDSIVEKYLYADVAVLAAAGGTGKSTLSIYEAIHIVLGRRLYGLDVKKPGPVLFITAEDRREVFAARLREIMNCIDLTPAEVADVLARIWVWDVTGSDLRLICVTDNMIVVTGLADRIVEAYQSTPPVLIVFDPMVSFGADEGRFNANEQALITAARRIVAGLGCCVRLIAHTGKANSREGSLDQYGFRGGSALADGSRMMTILQPWKPGQSDGPSPPLTLDASPQSSITILARAKLSYCESQPILWIAREGWNFTYATDITISPEMAKKEREMQILVFLADQIKSDRRYSRRALEDCADTLGMTRAQVRSALSELTVSGKVMDLDLPKEQQHGRRQTFLFPSHFSEK